MHRRNAIAVPSSRCSHGEVAQLFVAEYAFRPALSAPSAPSLPADTQLAENPTELDRLLAREGSRGKGRRKSLPADEDWEAKAEEGEEEEEKRKRKTRTKTTRSETITRCA
ncbi:hypothetical protein KM043_005578 [Ampulex compressa]|nr:hypothetical protein KM043_005578 [Ampulex compressa]